MTAADEVQSDILAFQAAEKRLEQLERRVYGQGWQSFCFHQGFKYLRAILFYSSNQRSTGGNKL